MISRLSQLFRVLFLFVCRFAWRITGLRSAGWRLVRALRSRDETVRTVAGIFLVREGDRAVPLLHEALHRRESTEMTLRILGDIGDPNSEPELARFADDADEDVAQAARDALENLRLNS